MKNGICKRDGHHYRVTECKALYWTERNITKIRDCTACGKRQWYYQEVWIDEVKETPVHKKPKQIDERQESMF